jgi:hypothetical protein
VILAAEAEIVLPAWLVVALFCAGVLLTAATVVTVLWAMFFRKSPGRGFDVITGNKP